MPRGSPPSAPSTPSGRVCDGAGQGTDISTAPAPVLHADIHSGTTLTRTELTSTGWVRYVSKGPGQVGVGQRASSWQHRGAAGRVCDGAGQGTDRSTAPAPVLHADIHSGTTLTRTELTSTGWVRYVSKGPGQVGVGQRASSWQHRGAAGRVCDGVHVGIPS
jgi:hypothetical protein